MAESALRGGSGPLHKGDDAVCGVLDDKIDEAGARERVMG